MTAQDAPQGDLPENTIGQYHIIEQTGVGGMATVYKAYHARLDRNVAIKVMHQSFLQDPNFIARFEREARIVARLEHPNIVPVYDFDEHDQQPYLVMKFIEGRTLKDVLREGTLSLDEIMRVMPKIADALTYAHEMGVLHRDMKPSNIMVDARGEPYLTDFGLARIAQQGESTLSADMMLGTPHYISPEQAQGAADIDARTDVYALGVILYELVTGSVPFSGETTYAIVHKHIYAAPPNPSEVNPEVPESVSRVLMKALSKEPGKRYDTPNAMIEAFRVAIDASGLQKLDQDRGSIAQSRIEQVQEHTPGGGKYVNIPQPYGSGPPISSSSARDRLNQFLEDIGGRMRQAADGLRQEIESNDKLKKLKDDVSNGIRVETQEHDNGREINIKLGSSAQRKQIDTASKAAAVVAARTPRGATPVERDWSMADHMLRRRINRRMQERIGFGIHLAVFIIAILIFFGIESSLQQGMLETFQSTEFQGGLVDAASYETAALATQAAQGIALALEPLTTIPFALGIMLMWGSGVIAHGLNVFYNSGRRYDRRRDELRDVMEKRYGEEWVDKVPPRQYVIQRNRIDGRYKQRLNFITHFISALFFTIAVAIMWDPISQTLAQLAQADTEVPPDLALLPVPGLVFAISMITVLIHGIVVAIKSVAGSDARERAVDREIERERSRTSLAYGKRKNEAFMPEAEPARYAKPKNESPSPAVRLTGDGEFTDSFMEELNDQDKQQRG